MGSAALQFELLREIFDLARAQRASLELDDIDRVVDLMAEREVLLTRLTKLACRDTRCCAGSSVYADMDRSYVNLRKAFDPQG